MNSIIKIVLLLFTSLALGQNPYYYKIDKSQGLLTNSVYDIYEAKDGFMWFATDKGLCNFNGYTFTYFNQENRTTKAGSCIREDGFGRIWYENFDGYLYYVENHSLNKLNQQKALGYFKYGFINNKLYVINEKGLDVYDLKNLTYCKTISLKTNFLSAVFFDKNQVFVFTDKLTIIENDSVKQELNYPEDFSKSFNSIIVEKCDKGVLICSKFKDYCYYFNDGFFTRKALNIEKTIVQNLSWCNNQNWLCTTSGILKLGSNKNYFDGVNVSYIYKTKNSNYWVSTLTDGLFFIEDFDTKLISTEETLTTITSNNTNLFIGTNNDKIITFNKPTNQFKTIYNGKNNHQIGQLFYDNFNKQLLFTSSKFGFLNANNKLTKEFSIAVKSVYPIDSKYLAFASSGSLGLFKLHSKADSKWDFIFEKQNSKNQPDFSNIIKNARGKATIYCAQNNCILYATNNGLSSVNDNGKITEITLNNKSLNINKLSKKGNLIFATNNDFKLFEINNLKVKKLNLPKTIDSTTIEKSFLVEDQFFIVTNRYIYEYSITNKTIKTILKVNNEIEINDIIKEKNSYYISSNRGLIIKNSIQNNKINPIFKINYIKANKSSVAKNHLDKLCYDQNNISIYFTLISASPFEENSLKYRINGLEWQKLTNSNSKLVLNSLNSGDYKIEFSLNDVPVSNQKVHFTINKPFWYQWPFLVFFSLITIGIFYLIYRRNIKKIEKQNQLVLDKINLEKNVNQSKLKAIKSQMNPHFFYNALNTLQSYILSNEKRQAIDYLSKFSNLTRTILEMTEKDYISIAEEAKTLQLYLDIEKVRFENDFNYTIEIEKKIDQDKTKIPSMLLQPYVENAVKHGLLHKEGSKSIVISFNLIDTEIEILIDDNGIGRLKSAELNAIKNKKHNSFATKALQNRVDLLNQYNQKNIRLEIIDKYNVQNIATGTVVKIKIPIEDL